MNTIFSRKNKKLNKKTQLTVHHFVVAMKRTHSEASGTHTLTLSVVHVTPTATIPYEISVQRNETILQVKEQVEQYVQLPALSMRLIYQGSSWDDSKMVRFFVSVTQFH